MPIPFLADSISTLFDLTPYMKWRGDCMQSDFTIDTTIIKTNSTDAQIHEQLRDIYVNGVGYSDIVSIISIPLIIALFAFSFPFIFQTINHINNKYASKHISTLFRTSIICKLFWIINFLSILYVVVYGASSLLWKECLFVRYSQVVNLITLFVAFIYACIVTAFVRYCTSFNNPDKLLSIIKKRHVTDKRIVWGQQKMKFLKVKLRALFRHKDKAGNSLYKSASDLVFRLNNRVPEDNYLSRMIGVVCFSIKENDFGLFQNVLYCLDNIVDAEKRDFRNFWSSRKKDDDVIKESAVHYQTMRFFDELLTTYAPFSNAFMQDESIVFKLAGSFDKSKYMNSVDSFHLAVCMRKMVDHGNMILLEKYIDYTQYYFKYLRNLPRVYYVKGGLPEGRADVEKESDQSWNDLACVHYAVFAYAFDKCDYSLLKTHLDRNHFNDYNLFPKTGADILIRYAHCMKNTWHLSDDKLFGRKVDIKSLLSRYTVALLLLVPEIEENEYWVTESITKEIIDTIKESKSLLEKEVNSVKTNATLLVLYPGLADENFGAKFNHFFSIIQSFNYLLELEDIEKAGKKRNRTVLFRSLFKRLFGITSAEQTMRPQINLYTVKLNEALTNDLSIRFKQYIIEESRLIPKELFTTVLDGKNTEIFVNPCQLLVNKLFFLDKKYYDDYLYYTFIEQISTRIIYIALSSFRKMKLKVANVKSQNFDIFFDKFTKGNRNDYVLIGVDSPWESFLNIKFQGQDRFYERTVPYIDIDESSKPLLADLDDYIYFKGSVLIVAKKDLPAIVDMDEKEGITVDYKDISDESELQLNVRTTVDIHKKVVFNPNAKIAVVKHKRMIF